MKMMKQFAQIVLVLAIVFAGPSVLSAQCSGLGGYVESGNEIPCSEGGPCCTVYNACNAPCNNYDNDFPLTGGCDMACTPIDSGVLFILIGGGLFGAFMLNRRRELELVTEEVKS
jgi:hypothetical protein